MDYLRLYHLFHKHTFTDPFNRDGRIEMRRKHENIFDIINFLKEKPWRDRWENVDPKYMVDNDFDYIIKED